ncbi:MAG: AMP-binding protein [Gammaproteobacteria bacterium]|nr:AMP-binding protein [Gammaproteobacteria bacterium]MYJ51723.1 AMP-binding protein [Gammaproteobacteria bacterium]
MKECYDRLPRIEGLNHVQLTPISFLKRACDVYPDHESIVYGSRTYTWHSTADRCLGLASGLRKLGVSTGTTVAMMAANTPELAEAHFGVPMSRGVLNSINTRLDPDTIAYILDHGDAQVLITDTQFSPVISKALDKLDTRPMVIDIVDEQAEGGERLGTMTYEDLLTIGDGTGDWGFPESEWDALTLNYTSGTSGRPKGVVYHHRGSYLMSMGTVSAWQIPKHPRYLYTVPMFHCNGWGHVWTMTLMGGTLVCNRAVNAETIFRSIREHRITHFGAAPIVLAMLANAPEEVRYTPDYTVEVMTAGAPPPSKILERSQRLGFNVTHVYGLTETYGHVVFCDWKAQWSQLDIDRQAEIKARQGVRFPMMESARVVDTRTGEDVPADGSTMGEVVLQGNPVMKGYYKNPEATDEAFKDGWFHSGDLAVLYPDGYLEIKDRLKDIIISGGENISSIEVESALYKHPKVAAAAVIAKPDENWGETPCAFVELKPGEAATEDEIIDFCRDHMAGYKRPRHVVFLELPKTSTGKIQKFKLRGLIEDGKV